MLKIKTRLRWEFFSMDISRLHFLTQLDRIPCSRQLTTGLGVIQRPNYSDNENAQRLFLGYTIEIS